MQSSSRAGKPTLLSWILKQPSPKKEVLLQAFTGVQLEDCAGRNAMSRDEVMAILKDFTEHAPELEEDRYEMAYHASSGERDFCQTPHQNEGVYLFMKLRFGEKKIKAPQPAVSVAAQSVDRPVSAAPKKRASRKKAAGTAAAAEEAAPEPAPVPKVLTEEEKAEAERRREARKAARERRRNNRF